MVPARAGSRGLPGKNTRILAGKPLIQYAIEAALGCPGVKATYVNSDDPKCLEIGKGLGAKTYARPAQFANDTATMQSVAQDFVRHLKEKGERYDAVIVLYPTFPFRTSEDLKAILEVFWNGGGDRPLLTIKASRSHPYTFVKLTGDRHPVPFCDVDLNQYYRRQDYPPAYELKHWACVLPFDQVEGLNAQLSNDRSFVMECEAEKLVDIDTQEDWAAAERVLAKAASP